MSSLGYVAAFLGGGVLGWLVYYLVDLRGVPQSLPPTAAASADRLEVEVLRWSTTGYLVMDATGRPLLHNDRASELGVIRGGIVNREVVAAAGRSGVSGESVDLELRPVSSTASLTARSRPIAVHAVVRPIGSDRILVSATDETAAQRMEAARRDFVANVSHELKTPVAAMGLLAEATVDAADDPEEARRFAGKLQAEAVRMAALVNELIALSRLQGADPLPDLAVVEIDAVVRETVSRTASAAERARITVICDEPSGLLVRGDRALLVTALTNLVDNAINYSTAGTQVSISRGLTDGWVQVAVTDRGIGIPPEYTERVFERFFRIDPARSRSTGGTGLGLAIVKHVAANHGGSVTVWSRPGTGSTFTLRLPAVPQQPSFEQPASAPRSSEVMTSERPVSQLPPSEPSPNGPSPNGPSPTQHSSPRQSPTQHSPTQHSSTQESPTRQSPTQHSSTRQSPTQHSTTRHSSTRHSPTRHSSTQHSSTQHSPTQHSSTRHSPTQHSPTQHSPTQPSPTRQPRPAVTPAGPADDPSTPEPAHRGAP